MGQFHEARDWIEAGSFRHVLVWEGKRFPNRKANYLYDLLRKTLPNVGVGIGGEAILSNYFDLVVFVSSQDQADYRYGRCPKKFPKIPTVLINEEGFLKC